MNKENRRESKEKREKKCFLKTIISAILPGIFSLNPCWSSWRIPSLSARLRLKFSQILSSFGNSSVKGQNDHRRIHSLHHCDFLGFPSAQNRFNHGFVFALLAFVGLKEKNVSLQKSQYWRFCDLRWNARSRSEHFHVCSRNQGSKTFFGTVLPCIGG